MRGMYSLLSDESHAVIGMTWEKNGKKNNGLFSKRSPIFINFSDGRTELVLVQYGENPIQILYFDLSPSGEIVISRQRDLPVRRLCLAYVWLSTVRYDRLLLNLSFQRKRTITSRALPANIKQLSAE